MTDSNISRVVRPPVVDDGSSTTMAMLGPIGGSPWHRFAFGVAIVVALVLFGIQAGAVGDNARRGVGFGFEEAGPGLEVVEVVPDGPAEVGHLLVGDRILMVRDVGVEEGIDYDRVASGFVPGDAVIFRVLRGNRLVDLTIEPGRPPQWRGVIVKGLLMLGCMAVAMIACRRLGDLRARLLAWLLILVALEMALPWNTIGSIPVALIENSVYRLMAGAQMGVVLHLASVIPNRRVWLRRWPALGPAFHAVGWALGLTAAVTFVWESLFDGRWPPAVSALHPDTVLLDIAMPCWAVLATLALLGRALRGPSATGRAQAAMILFGLVPWTVQILWVTMVDRFDLSLPDPGPLYELGALLFAVATMVAIFRFQLFDITLAVRRGLVYTVVSALTVGLLYTVLLLGGVFGYQGFDMRSPSWLLLVLMFLLGVAFDPMRRLVQQVIDRRVFPQRSALRQQLIALTNELPTLGALPAMGRRLTSEVRRMFGSNNASLLLADPQTGLLTTLVSKEAARKETTQVPMFMAPKDPALKRLAREAQPREITKLGPLSDDVAARLSKLRAELLVPLMAHDAMVGLLILGNRIEGPYAAEEKELLQLLAQHAATVFENVRLFESATYESLTGLLRREAVLDLLRREVERARRYRRPLTVALADLDHFKQVNDVYGHQTGDIVLRAVAAELATGRRSTDAVGRYGGEEFLIVLPETTLEQAATVAEDIRRRVASLRVPTVDHDDTVPVRISIGLASYEDIEDTEGDPAETLVAGADRALYRAKRAGRDRVESGVLDADLVAQVRAAAAALDRKQSGT